MAGLRKRRLRAHRRRVSHGTPVTRLRDMLLLAAFSGCQFGGPSTSPSQYVSFPDAADDGSIELPGDDVDDVTVGPPAEASPAAPATDGSADDAFENPPSPDAAGLDAGECNPTVAVCDPVHNTGCNPLQQCDVAPSQTTPTGLCV